MTLALPDAPDLEHLKTQAKRLLAAYMSRDREALRRVSVTITQHAGAGQPKSLKLAEAQLVIAREYGFTSWQKLRRHVEGLQQSTAAKSSPTKFRQIVVELHLADVASASALFETHLGFKRGYTIAYADGTLDFAVLVNDPVEILLHNFNSDIQPDIPKHVRLYFRTVDALGLHANLTAGGLPVSDIVNTDYSSIEFSLMGPEGYMLMFQQFV